MIGKIRAGAGLTARAAKRPPLSGRASRFSPASGQRALRRRRRRQRPALGIRAVRRRASRATSATSRTDRPVALLKVLCMESISSLAAPVPMDSCPNLRRACTGGRAGSRRSIHSIAITLPTGPTGSASPRERVRTLSAQPEPGQKFRRMKPIPWVEARVGRRVLATPEQAWQGRTAKNSSSTHDRPSPRKAASRTGVEELHRPRASPDLDRESCRHEASENGWLGRRTTPHRNRDGDRSGQDVIRDRPARGRSRRRFAGPKK